MKTIVTLLLGLCLAASMQAITPAAPPTAPPLTTDQLDQLVGPLALYPDSLIALILPASTVPSDIVIAARFQTGNGDPAQIPDQPWDGSVKSLTRYPVVLAWLNQNLDWTTQLGDAFLSQPADVMDAIQQLRAQAIAAGHLVNTAQQQVVVDDGDISIQPTNPQMIYVPQYDSDMIYDDGGYADTDPFITFGMGYAAGAWLNYGMDWRHHGVYLGDWGTGADYLGRVNVAGGYANLSNGRRWQPGANSLLRASRAAHQGIRAVSHAAPLPGVTIPHGSRAAATRHAGVPTAGGRNANNSAKPQGRDFTGRGAVSPAVSAVLRQRSAPTAISQAATAQGGIFNNSRRGSDVRQSSNRGQLSRQQTVAPAVRRQSPAPVNRPAPVRAAPAARSAPAPGAFHMNPAPAAAAASARGAQSRGRR
jgi:hypothetical protein